MTVVLHLLRITMNKFEFHLLTAFYNYFKNEIPKRDNILALHLKDSLEVLIKLCDEVLEKYE